MADLTYTQTSAAARFSMRSLLDRIFNALIALGESSSTARALTQVSQMSDAEIKARGTTREALVRGILASHGHV